jgi:hypothetical protein
VMWWQGKGGLGPASMTSGPFHSHWFVKWLGASNFVYGRVSSIDFPSLGAPNPQFLSYPVSGTATGAVNGNEVTISVPLATLMGLTAGDKIDNITAYGLGGAGSVGVVPVPFVVDQAKAFSYVIGTPAAGQHLPDGYVQVSLDNFATSTVATLNNTNNTWTASLPASGSGTVCARQVLAKDLYTPLWDDVQAGPVSCANFSVPPPPGAVSRKTHGTAGTFDIDLLPPASGIECRTGGASGDHQIVVTFAVPVTLSSANVSSGTGSVSSVNVNGNQVFVNLTGVANAQTIAITLVSVNDGTNTGNVVIPMSVLLGDTTANKSVNSSDISQTKAQSGTIPTASTFRTDVTVNGLINSSDISTVKSKSGTALP